MDDYHDVILSKDLDTSFLLVLDSSEMLGVKIHSFCPLDFLNEESAKVLITDPVMWYLVRTALIS
jgi:hypothetical protein